MKIFLKKFRNIVLALESFKWKVIKKIFPNYLSFIEKRIDKNLIKQLRKLPKEKEEETILMAKTLKILLRKEFETERNINYHADEHNPESFIYFLEYNKKIHQNGLKKDLIITPVVIAISIFITPWILPLLGYILSSMGINFACIKLQDENIRKVKEQMPEKRKKAEKLIDRTLKIAPDAVAEISKAILTHKNTEEINPLSPAPLPTIEEIVLSVIESGDKELLEQLKELLLEEYTKREERKKGVQK